LDSNRLLDRNGARDLLNADEGWPELQIKRGRRTSVPSDRGGGVKFAQAVVSQTRDGKWKMFIQSDRQVEMSLTGVLEDIIKELKHAASHDWERRS
jgi:hypothetical protein